MFAYHGDEATNRDLSRAGVDVDHRDVAAKGKGQIGWVVVVGGLEPGLHPGWMVGVGGKGNLLDGLGLVG